MSHTNQNPERIEVTPTAVASSDLLACPFCGGLEVGTLETGLSKGTVILICLTSGDCTGGVWGETIEECRRRWNRRSG